MYDAGNSDQGGGDAAGVESAFGVVQRSLSEAANLSAQDHPLGHGQLAGFPRFGDPTAPAGQQPLQPPPRRSSSTSGYVEVEQTRGVEWANMSRASYDAVGGDASSHLYAGASPLQTAADGAAVCLDVDAAGNDSTQPQPPAANVDAQYDEIECPTVAGATSTEAQYDEVLESFNLRSADSDASLVVGAAAGGKPQYDVLENPDAQTNTHRTASLYDQMLAVSCGGVYPLSLLPQGRARWGSFSRLRSACASAGERERRRKGVCVCVRVCVCVCVCVCEERRHPTSPRVACLCMPVR